MSNFTEAQVADLYGTPAKLAPWLIGLWGDWVTLGLLVNMFGTFLEHGYRVERRLVKVLVTYLVFMSLAISCFNLASQTNLFVLGFGHLDNFLDPRYFGAGWLLLLAVKFPVTLWSAHRAFNMSRRSRLISFTLFPLLMMSSACAIGAFATSIKTQLPIPFNAGGRILATAFCCVELVHSLIISGTISLELDRSQAEWRTIECDSEVYRWIFVLAETQLPSMLAGLGIIIHFLCSPSDSIIICWQGIAKMQIICMLLVVNMGIKARVAACDETSMTSSQQSKLQVSIETETRIHTSEPDISTTPTPLHSTIDDKGRTRTANGRLVGAERGIRYYSEMDSKTSLFE